MEIYLDNASTTEPFPEVIDAMMPYLSDEYGNPSTIYSIGRRTRKAIDEARDTVAGLLSVKSSEISFCSGATESICTLLIGAAFAAKEGRKKFVTSSIEHKAILKVAHWLMDYLDWEVTLIDPMPSGHINPKEFTEACSKGCGLASLQWVNNEIGTIQPIEEVGLKLKGMGIPFHTDVVQGIGKFPLDLGATGIAMASASSHKFYGPKGCGLSYIREGIDVRPLLVGGGQELERRAGTENVAGIVGTATALSVLARGQKAFVERLVELERIFFDTLNSSGIEYALNGGEPRVPGMMNIFFPGVESESLLLHADREGLCISAGSACASGSTEPSYVITALGGNRMRGLCSARVTFGWHNTNEDAITGAKTIGSIVAKLRGST